MSRILLAQAPRHFPPWLILCVRRSMHHLVLSLFLSLAVAACSRGDTWPPPTLKVVASPDGSALLRILPARPDQGGSAQAALLKFDPATGSYQKVREFALRNPAAPHDVVVTNNGAYVVTFDDWGGLGRTANVVVVYRGTGELVRAWKLEEIFTPEERKHFSSSTSSTWWRGEVSLLENSRQSPLVIIQPETRMAVLDRKRLVGPALYFDIVKLEFRRP